MPKGANSVASTTVTTRTAICEGCGRSYQGLTPAVGRLMNMHVAACTKSDPKSNRDTMEIAHGRLLAGRSPGSVFGEPVINVLSSDNTRPVQPQTGRIRGREMRRGVRLDVDAATALIDALMS